MFTSLWPWNRKKQKGTRARYPLQWKHLPSPHLVIYILQAGSTFHCVLTYGFTYRLTVAVFIIISESAASLGPSLYTSGCRESISYLQVTGTCWMHSKLLREKVLPMFKRKKVLKLITWVSISENWKKESKLLRHKCKKTSKN